MSEKEVSGGMGWDPPQLEYPTAHTPKYPSLLPSLGTLHCLLYPNTSALLNSPPPPPSRWAWLIKHLKALVSVCVCMWRCDCVCEQACVCEHMPVRACVCVVFWGGEEGWYHLDSKV